MQKYQQLGTTVAKRLHNSKRFSDRDTIRVISSNGFGSIRIEACAAKAIGTVYKSDNGPNTNDEGPVPRELCIAALQDVVARGYLHNKNRHGHLCFQEQEAALGNATWLVGSPCH